MEIGTPVKFHSDVVYMGGRVTIPHGTTGRVISTKIKDDVLMVLVRFDVSLVVYRTPEGWVNDLSTAYVAETALEKLN